MLEPITKEEVWERYKVAHLAWFEWNEHHTDCSEETLATEQYLREICDRWGDIWDAISDDGIDPLTAILCHE